MGSKEIFIVKRDIADNTKTVSYNTKLKDIAEMPIDVELLNFRVRSCMGWHRAVSCFIRVIGIIESHSFFIVLQLAYDGIGIFGVVFSNISLNTRSIEGKH
jgi:hypothetical protein